MASHTYKNLIFTKHALERMKSRTISPDRIYQVITAPEKTFDGTQESKNKKYIKTLGGRTYHVVANYVTKERSWLVVSVWVRGEDDKPSLSIQLLMLPLRILWWIVKSLISLVWKRR